MIYSVGAALASRIELLGPLAKSRGIALKIFLPVSLQVQADPEVLAAIVDTLVDLALQKGCDGETLTINAQSPFKRLAMDIYLECNNQAPQSAELDQELETLQPLLQKAKAKLTLTNPTPNSLLFHLQL